MKGCEVRQLEQSLMCSMRRVVHFLTVKSDEKHSSCMAMLMVMSRNEGGKPSRRKKNFDKQYFS